MTIEMTCPTCGSHDISKNGTTRRVSRNDKCRDCNRQFVEDPQWKPKAKDTRSLVDLLLLEKIALAGITSATGVSDSWLQGHVNAGYEAVPKAADVVPRVIARHFVSFVLDKDRVGGRRELLPWMQLKISEFAQIIGFPLQPEGKSDGPGLWSSECSNRKNNGKLKSSAERACNIFRI
jgi:insertion element IS1 protein InsB